VNTRALPKGCLCQAQQLLVLQEELLDTLLRLMMQGIEKAWCSHLLLVSQAYWQNTDDDDDGGELQSKIEARHASTWSQHSGSHWAQPGMVTARQHKSKKDHQPSA
jgi:hypothetical protein